MRVYRALNGVMAAICLCGAAGALFAVTQFNGPGAMLFAVFTTVNLACAGDSLHAAIHG